MFAVSRFVPLHSSAALWCVSFVPKQGERTLAVSCFTLVTHCHAKWPYGIPIQQLGSRVMLLQGVVLQPLTQRRSSSREQLQSSGDLLVHIKYTKR